ncbi:homoserine kinase [Arcanobacterium hippocoleae]
MGKVEKAGKEQKTEVLGTARKVRVRVPATTANLGPGFDSFGCALSLYNTVEFAPVSNGLEWADYPAAFANKENLIYQGFSAVFEYLGMPVPGVRIAADEQIPFSRGLGSSAVMLTAGALGANALAGNPLSREQLLVITNKIEGHPDNLAPAFFGGMTVSAVDNAGVPITRIFPVHPDWKFLVFIPDFPLPTAQARAVLPAQVSRADAIFNISHAALLLKAFESGDLDLLRFALDDRLHQPYRRHLIPGIAEIDDQVNQFGGKLCISGAGPTLLCITKGSAAGRIDIPDGWKAIYLDVDVNGAGIETV